jgi:hypothetical protein
LLILLELISLLLVINPNIRPRQIELLLFNVPHGLEDIEVEESRKRKEMVATGRFTASQDIFKRRKLRNYWGKRTEFVLKEQLDLMINCKSDLQSFPESCAASAFLKLE